MSKVDYLLASDIASGVVAAVFSSAMGEKKMWMPFVMNTVLSVLGRMGESKLEFKDDKGNVQYLKTSAIRSATIIAAVSVAVHKLYYNHSTTKTAVGTMMNVSSDALADEVISGILGTDTVLIAANKSG
jgi:uncharacterized protein YccT (UPF0319 family)